jgi:hypothetical protein
MTSILIKERIDMKKAFSKFMKSGKIEDYLNYKQMKHSMEISRELSMGEKDEIKRRNNNEKH